MDIDSFIQSLSESKPAPPQTLQEFLNTCSPHSFQHSNESTVIAAHDLDVFPVLKSKPSLFAKALAAKPKVSKDRILKLRKIRQDLVNQTVFTMDCPLILYNTKSQVKEMFLPKNPRDVRVYCCGPTVYDEPHLGHARTYIFYDILCRTLRYFKNYNVRSVMNITDYDDKIISKGGLTIARMYEKLFFDTMDKLNVQRPDFTPRASDFFNEAENYVKLLRKKGFVSSDNRFKTILYQNRYGVVFPDTRKRIPPQEGFLVWKDKKHADLEQVAKNGKPGWHTECAVMNAYYFGDYVDLHVGGIDLQFPHHENEIALGRVLFDKQDWIRYTLHTGHLEIDGRKMSKSDKSFIPLLEMLNRVTSPLAIRYLFLKHPYASPMQFNEEEVEKAQKSYNKLICKLEELKLFSEQEDTVSSEKPRWSQLHEFQLKIGNCITDNLNIPKAICTTEEFITTTLTSIENKPWLRYCLKYVMYVLDKYFGLLPHDTKERVDSLIPLVKLFRTQVREGALRKLKACDELRKQLNINGFVTEDSIK